jgi:hypothetical protein
MSRIVPLYLPLEPQLIVVLPFPTLDHSRSLRKVQATPLLLHSLLEDQRQDARQGTPLGKQTCAYHVVTEGYLNIVLVSLIFCA